MKKCKRHKWDIADESCWACGAYTERCVREDCFFVRYIENGKVQFQEETLY